MRFDISLAGADKEKEGGRVGERERALPTEGEVDENKGEKNEDEKKKKKDRW